MYESAYYVPITMRFEEHEQDSKESIHWTISHQTSEVGTPCNYNYYILMNIEIKGRFFKLGIMFPVYDNGPLSAFPRTIIPNSIFLVNSISVLFLCYSNSKLVKRNPMNWNTCSKIKFNSDTYLKRMIS